MDRFCDEGGGTLLTSILVIIILGLTTLAIWPYLPSSLPGTSSRDSTDTSNPETSSSGASPGKPAKTNGWRMTFVPVGQGDCHVIISPQGRVAVIDTAKKDSITPLIRYLRYLGLKKIHTLVLTHAHADHVGGVPRIFQEFQVGRVWATGEDHTTRTYETALRAIERANIPYIKVRRGENRNLLPNLPVRIIHPDRATYENPNNNSIAFDFGVNGVRFLYAADIEKKIEQDLVRKDLLKEVDVLKVGHQGSKTSSTKSFIGAIKPDVGVIPAPPKGMSPHGHPHDVTINTLNQYNVDIYHTGRDGFVEVIVDPSSEPGSYDINTFPKQAVAESFNLKTGQPVLKLSSASASSLTNNFVKKGNRRSNRWTIRNGLIELFAGNKSALWYDDFSAPRVMYTGRLPRRWMVETSVMFPGGRGREAGVILWWNRRSWMHWGPSGDNSMKLIKRGRRDIKTEFAINRQVPYFGLAWDGQNILGLYRNNNSGSWKVAGKISPPRRMSRVSVGLLAKSWSGGAGYTAKFKSLSIKPLQ
ncbi:MAG: ComEC/Rec2 family competence protein [bacterium]